jgi:hypothetical protein
MRVMTALLFSICSLGGAALADGTPPKAPTAAKRATGRVHKLWVGEVDGVSKDGATLTLRHVDGATNTVVTVVGRVTEDAKMVAQLQRGQMVSVTLTEGTPPRFSQLIVLPEERAGSPDDPRAGI